MVRSHGMIVEVCLLLICAIYTSDVMLLRRYSTRWTGSADKVGAEDSSTPNWMFPNGTRASSGAISVPERDHREGEGGLSTLRDHYLYG